MKKINDLIKDLTSSDNDLIKKSLEEIGDINGIKAIPSICILIKNFEDTEEVEIIDSAIWTLSRIANPQIVIDLLESSNKFIQLYSIEALGRMEAKNSGKYIKKFLNSSDIEIRAMAAWTIGRIIDKDCYEKILDLVQNDEDPEVRNNAAFALKKFNNLDSLKILKKQMSEDLDEAVLYNIDAAIKSMENSHEKNNEFNFNIYQCQFKDENCLKIKKEVIEFTDNNVFIKIVKSINCKKAQICGLEVKEL